MLSAFFLARLRSAFSVALSPLNAQSLAPFLSAAPLPIVLVFCPLLPVLAPIRPAVRPLRLSPCAPPPSPHGGIVQSRARATPQVRRAPPQATTRRPSLDTRRTSARTTARPTARRYRTPTNSGCRPKRSARGCQRRGHASRPILRLSLSNSLQADLQSRSYWQSCPSRRPSRWKVGFDAAAIAQALAARPQAHQTLFAVGLLLSYKHPPKHQYHECHHCREDKHNYVLSCHHVTFIARTISAALFVAV
jgi:hypothetical protein